MIDFSEIIVNSKTGESSETKANEDKPTTEDVNSGYDMTDNSAYRAAGTQTVSVPSHLPKIGQLLDLLQVVDMI